MYNELGLIHIYCGDGKGKTTAATGLAIRAAGNNLKVLISRFLKNDYSSELSILNAIKNIKVNCSKKDFGFFFNMTDKEKVEASIYYSEQLKSIFNEAFEQNYDVLILDEINVAISLGLVDENLLIELINTKPEHLELILTGRNPTKKLISMADYVSEIQCIKHPYEKGIQARKGIEEWFFLVIYSSTKIIFSI